LKHGVPKSAQHSISGGSSNEVESRVRIKSSGAERMNHDASRASRWIHGYDAGGNSPRPRKDKNPEEKNAEIRDHEMNSGRTCRGTRAK